MVTARFVETSPAKVPNPRARILVVEDDLNLLEGIQTVLELDHYAVVCAENGVQAVEVLRSTPLPDLIVSDIMMPQMDGIELLKAVRAVPEWVRIPFIFLTARGERQDIQRGKQLGVDDYLVKPFELAELELRCLALSHRKPRRQRVLAVGDLRYDLDTLECWRGDRAVSLFPVTRTLLTLLMQESPRVVSRERLIEAVWSDAPPQTDLLRRHIHELRRQLVQGAETALLHVVTGVGYVLRKAEGT